MLWLSELIRAEGIEVLVIAGDVFDTAAPGNVSLKMYYDFLTDVRHYGCRYVVIVGGNHDSPSLLEAPKELLAVLNVRVVGKANLDDEVFVLNDSCGEPSLIVCAVPFLRERDIAKYAEGESYSDRSARIFESIRRHYELVVEAAKEKRREAGRHLPVIATGHLSVSGGKTSEDDGVRETYIGSIECVGSEIFSSDFDYIALGHYHIPSRVSDSVFYSGSPIAMGFGEAGQIKRVLIVDFEGGRRRISERSIPCFQRLESIVGNREAISKRLQEIVASAESVWLEVVYTGSELFPDLASWASEQLVGSKAEILKVQNRRYLDTVLAQEDAARPLEDLNEYEVFDKLLCSRDFPEDQKEELKQLYRDTVASIKEREI